MIGATRLIVYSWCVGLVLAAYSKEIAVGKAIDLRDALPYDDLGIAHRGAVNIIKEEFMEQCIYEMGGPQTKQEEVISSSAQEFASAMAYDAGIDGALGGFKLAASRSVRQASDLHTHRTFAKKTVSIQIRSLNVKMECLKEKKYLHDHFYQDFTSLARHDLSHLPDFSYDEWEKYRVFLDRWGTAFLSSAIEGGAIEITMSEDVSSQSADDNIKNSLSASYLGLASVNAQIQTTLRNSLRKRDGYFNLLVAGGSKESRSSIQSRFENVLGDHIKEGEPSSINVTAVWSQSVESGYSVLTKGRYISWDRFPLNILNGWTGAGFLSKNLKMAISLHLANAWSLGCPVYYWNIERRLCDIEHAQDVLNKQVKIVTDKGYCVEYDEMTGKLMAKRKDCNMGLSIFTFHTQGSHFYLQLNNRGRLVGSLKPDFTVSLLPITAQLSKNFIVTPDNFLVYAQSDHEKSFALLNEETGYLEFVEKTPFKSQFNAKFYLELFHNGYGNPLASEAEFKDFLYRYNSHYKAPFFRIVAPFWGDHLAIEPVMKAPLYNPENDHDPWWWISGEKSLSFQQVQDDNVAQLWKFQTMKFIGGHLAVNMSNAMDNQHFCLDYKANQPSVNTCTRHDGWILEYAQEYNGAIRLKVPGADLCLYRLELSRMAKDNEIETSYSYDLQTRKLDDGFRVQSCLTASHPEYLMSLFKLQVVLNPV